MTLLPTPIDIKTGPVALAGKDILAPLDLHLSEQRIGIIGRNGSGKTTFLRLLGGLIAAQSGGVLIGGHDPFKDRKAALRKIGIMFQNPDRQILFPLIEEELAFGLTQLGLSKAEAKDRVQKSLSRDGLSHWIGQSTQALSQGQRQYLCLLAILMMEPETILLDEPFAALDLPTRLQLSRRLAALPQRLIFITHEPATVYNADRLLWIDSGNLIADGKPADILPRFEAEMTRIAEESLC